MFESSKHSTLFMRFLFWLTSILLISACFSACEIQGDKDIGLDIQPQIQDINVYFTDTVTIHTSTVLLDSIATTNTGYLISGQYLHPLVGNAGATSFFSIGINESSPSIATSAVYDSLVLLLDYDTYSYGDTTQMQHLSVHQLIDPLVDTKVYYGFDQLAYVSEAMGSKVFQPRPFTQVPLSIRLSDQMGEEMFNLAKANSLTSSMEVKNYIKGFALVPGNEDNASILRFNASSDSTVIRLYYHETNLDTEKRTYDFKISNGGSYFNGFTGDRTSTDIALLQTTFQSIPSQTTQQQTYIQGGTGLRTRIDIPYLRSLNTIGNVGMNGATLVIEPVKGTYSSSVSLPESIVLQEVNGSNWIINTTAETSISLQAEHQNETYYYKYDLTSYVNNVFAESTNSKNGLLLSLPSTDNQNTLQTLVLGSNSNGQYKIKLEIYYTRAL